MNSKQMYLSPCTEVLEVELSGVIAASENIADRDDFTTEDLIFGESMISTLMF